MKVCRRPFNYLYLDHFRGDVWLCPWMVKGSAVGNLFANSLEEIWTGEKAQKIRAHIASGDFSICRPDGCPMLPNNDVPDVEGDELTQLITPAPTPEYINLAYDFLCNQWCETCRTQKFRPWGDYRNKVAAITRALRPYLPHARHISLSGHGEVFASPYMMALLEELRPASTDLRISLETNGVYLDERHWQRIAHLHSHILEINVTVNSFDEFTYRHISRGGNYQKLLHNLSFIKSLRQSGSLPLFYIGIVLQDRNFRELPSFIRRAREEYGCDKVIIKPVYQWGTMPEDLFWFKDVLNPMHPYHAEYLEIMNTPVTGAHYVYNFCAGQAHPSRPFPGHSLPQAGARP